MKRWPTIPVAPRMPIFCRCMILFPISEDVHQGPHRSCAGLFAVRTSVTVSYTGVYPPETRAAKRKGLRIPAKALIPKTESTLSSRPEPKAKWRDLQFLLLCVRDQSHAMHTGSLMEFPTARSARGTIFRLCLQAPD